MARYRRVSGDSVDGGVNHDSPPSQSDAPLNLSAVSKHSDNDKSESGGGCQITYLYVLLYLIFIVLPVQD